MPFCEHGFNIALKRLKEFCLEPVIILNVLKGVENIFTLTLDNGQFT